MRRPGCSEETGPHRLAEINMPPHWVAAPNETSWTAVVTNRQVAQRRRRRSRQAFASGLAASGTPVGSVTDSCMRTTSLASGGEGRLTAPTTTAAARLWQASSRKILP